MVLPPVRTSPMPIPPSSAPEPRSEPDLPVPIVADLLARTRAGDRAARDELVSLLSPWVRSRAHNRLQGPVRAREQTEDVSQDVLTSLVEQFPESRDLNHLIAHLRTMIHAQVHDVINRHTRAKRDLRREDQLGDAAGELVDGVARREITPPLESIERKESLQILRVILDTLRPIDRRSLEAFLRGEPLSVTANSLGLSVDAARMRASRAIFAVQRAWRRQCPDRDLPLVPPPDPTETDHEPRVDPQ